MRKKSKYRPKYGPDANPLHIALLGCKKLAKNDQINRLSRVREAVDRFKACKQELNDWGIICETINIMEGFQKVGLVKDADEFVEELQDMVVQVVERHKNTGSNVLTPSEIKKLQNLIAVYADILEVATNSELFKAEEYVQNRIRSIVGTRRISAEHLQYQVTRSIAA